MPHEPQSRRTGPAPTNGVAIPAPHQPRVPPQAYPGGSSPAARRRPAVHPTADARAAEAGTGTAPRLNTVRTRLADLIWLAAVLAAIVLSLGALLVALGANLDNALVSTVLDVGHAIDGPFWLVFEFFEDQPGAGGAQVPDDVKNYLVNWGLAAVAYLVVGRVVHRLVRP